MRLKNKPRRAGSRWLEGAPEYVRDCFHNTKKWHGTSEEWEVWLGTAYDSVIDGAVVEVQGIASSTNGTHHFLIMIPREFAAHRYRSKNRRIKWKDLPKAVCDLVEQVDWEVSNL